MHYRHTKPASGLVLGYAAINEANMPAAFRSLKQAFIEATSPLGGSPIPSHSAINRQSD